MRKKAVVVIGGSGFADKLKGAEKQVRTAFGDVAVLTSRIGEREVYAIRRHGARHNVPPHRVDYKAHVYVAKEVGAEAIFASTAVGVIRADAYSPGDLILCNDLIAFWLRFSNGGAVTYHDSFDDGPHHVDASELFARNLNEVLLRAARELGLTLKTEARLTTTIGPRFESHAEIRALQILGADLVGMTTGYEAILARELGIPYAVVAIGTNWAAGLGERALSHGEVLEMMSSRGENVFALLTKAIEIM